jgi:hypothetical protein
MVNKKFTRTVFIIFIVWGLSSFTVTNVSAILLGEISAKRLGNQSSSGLYGASVTESVFLLGYGYNGPSGGSQPYGIDMDLLLGAEVVWPIGDVGIYDFNASNSSDFTQISDRLTDGIDETVTTGNIVFLDGVSNDRLLSTGAGLEQSRISGDHDLYGASIDFIRLIVENNSSSVTSYPENEYGKIDYNLVGSFEIYGTAAPVPEPATMLLFGSGLIGLAGFRKKFKK